MRRTTVDSKADGTADFSEESEERREKGFEEPSSRRTRVSHHPLDPLLITIVLFFVTFSKYHSYFAKNGHENAAGEYESHILLPL